MEHEESQQRSKPILLKQKKKEKVLEGGRERPNGKNNQYLHGFEDVDKGVASHQKNFLCKIGLEKLHTCY
jgi:hypothetical protein